MSLQGKIALVTGASRGTGRAIALRLAKDGAAVVVNYAGSRPQAEEVVAAIDKAGGRAVAVQADVSKVGGVVRLFDAGALTGSGRSPPHFPATQEERT
jgi:3-oxoacyl-[acyl-carrier protein] reductase